MLIVYVKFRLQLNLTFIMYNRQSHPKPLPLLQVILRHGIPVEEIAVSCRISQDVLTASLKGNYPDIDKQIEVVSYINSRSNRHYVRRELFPLMKEIIMYRLPHRSYIYC